MITLTDPGRAISDQEWIPALYQQCQLTPLQAPERPDIDPGGPGPVEDTYRGMGSGVEKWRSLVAAYFLPVDVGTALCLMGYESGGNPDAENPSSGAAGLMQVLPGWAPVFGVSVSDLFDPEVNLMVAAVLRYDGGWTHWAPYTRGLCHD